MVSGVSSSRAPRLFNGGAIQIFDTCHLSADKGHGGGTYLRDSSGADVHRWMLRRQSMSPDAWMIVETDAGAPAGRLVDSK